MICGRKHFDSFTASLIKAFIVYTQSVPAGAKLYALSEINVREYLDKISHKLVTVPS